LFQIHATMFWVAWILLMTVVACLEPEYENEFGNTQIEFAKTLINNCVDEVFHYQDVIRFEMEESNRNISRFLDSANFSIKDSQRFFKKINIRLKTMELLDPKDTKIDILESRLISNLISSLKDTDSLTKTLITDLEILMIKVTSHQRSSDACFASVKTTNLSFNNLTSESLQEMFDRSKELQDLNRLIQGTLQDIDDKNEELLALEVSLVALEAASLASLSGGPIGWVIGGTAAAAALAVSVAKGHLQQELQDSMDLYIKKSAEFAKELEDQGNIVLDTETKDFFLDRLAVLSTAYVHIKRNVSGKIPKWQEFVGNLETLKNLLLTTQNVLNKNILRFYDIDVTLLVNVLENLEIQSQFLY